MRWMPVRPAVPLLAFLCVALSGCDCFDSSTARWHDPALFFDVPGEAELPPWHLVTPPPDMPLQDADLAGAWGHYALRSVANGPQTIAGRQLELVGRNLTLRYEGEDALARQRDAARDLLMQLGVAAGDLDALLDDLARNQTSAVTGTCPGCGPSLQAYEYTALLPAGAVGAQAAWDPLRPDIARSPDEDDVLGEATLSFQGWSFLFQVPVKQAETPAGAWLRVDADGQADLLADGFGKEDGDVGDLAKWAVQQMRQAGWSAPSPDQVEARVSAC